MFSSHDVIIQYQISQLTSQLEQHLFIVCELEN